MTFNIAHASAMVGALVLGVLLPAMAEDLGLSPLEQGWLGSSAIIGSLIFSIPFGLWMSRFRPMLLTAITLFLGLVSCSCRQRPQTLWSCCLDVCFSG